MGGSGLATSISWEALTGCDPSGENSLSLAVTDVGRDDDVLGSCAEGSGTIFMSSAVVLMRTGDPICSSLTGRWLLVDRLDDDTLSFKLLKSGNTAPGGNIGDVDALFVYRMKPGDSERVGGGYVAERGASYESIGTWYRSIHKSLNRGVPNG